MRRVLLHGTVSVLITSTSYDHVGLLAEEGLCRACTVLLKLVRPSSGLMMLCHFVSHESAYLMVILAKMMTLNFGCLGVQRVRFCSADAPTIRLLEIIAATSVKRVRLRRIYQIKSVLIRLHLLTVASRFTGADAGSRYHLVAATGPSICRLTIASSTACVDERVRLNWAGATWTLRCVLLE